MIEIEGPYSFKDIDGLKTPVYLFLPGGERKNIGEATVKIDGGTTFDVQLDEKYKDIETAHFDVPMHYTYLNLPARSLINWGYNCLTSGVHHGRPEAIWNLPLLQASQMFSADDLAMLVLTRIHKDALQITLHNQEYTTAWANQIRVIAEQEYHSTFQHKIGELDRYYRSPEHKRELHDAVERFAEDKLNAYYPALHSHDSINMLCRILGTKSSRKVDETI